jgi:O-antigen/teichoic acid export membrane protein
MLHKITPVRFGFDPVVARKLSRLGFVYGLSIFAITLNYRLNIVMLQQLSDLKQVGLYTLGTTFAELIWQIPAALTAIVFSRSATAEKDVEFTGKVLVLARIALAAGTLVAIGLAIAGPYFIPFLYGQQFAPSAIVLTTMLPGIVAFIIFKIFNVDLAGKGKPWAAMAVVAPCFLLNILAGFLLIPSYGAIGAAMAASISYCAAAIGFVVLYSRVLKVPLADIVLFRRSDFELLAAKVPVFKKFF